MRTHFHITQPNGDTISGYQDLVDRPLTDSAMTELAAQDLVRVTYVYKDGHSVEYTAIEYECEWCGSYDGHSIDSCSNLDNDDTPYPEGPGDHS